MKTLLILPLFALVMCLTGCETLGSTRTKQDTINQNPKLAELDIVDLAVLPPSVTSSDANVLASRIRMTASQYMVSAKNYAVLEASYVDEAIQTHPASAGPESGANVTGADAALYFVLEEWETGALLPKGRLFASGQAALIGTDGQILWERLFSDWTLLAPRNVTGSNRQEVVDEMLEMLVRDVLSPIPGKLGR